MSITAPLSTGRALAYVAAILGLFAALQWHEDYTEQLIAAREFTARQQRIDAIRVMDCGLSPVYLAQAPGDAE